MKQVKGNTKAKKQREKSSGEHIKGILEFVLEFPTEGSHIPHEYLEIYGWINCSLLVCNSVNYSKPQVEGILSSIRDQRTKKQ